MTIDTSMQNSDAEHDWCPRMSEVMDLDRRLSRAIEYGRSIQLSAAELDLLVMWGAIDVLRSAVSAQFKAAAQERLAQRAADQRTAADTRPLGTEEMES